MISPKSLSLTALLLGATANAQVYETGGRSEDAFSWIQPEDTIVLDQYNSSEPIYPSRECDINPITNSALLIRSQLVSLMRTAGKMVWKKPVHSLLSSHCKRRPTWVRCIL
jgi:hypothetical protein